MVRRRARSTSVIAWAFGLALVCAWSVGPRVAHAQSPLDLTWNAPPGCPDDAWVLAGVQRLVVKMPPETLHVTAAAREEGDRWVVDLAMQGAVSGTRTLRAASCTSVARATALIVALALDPQAASRAAGEPAPAEPPSPETTDRGPAVPEAAPKPAPVSLQPATPTPVKEVSLSTEIGLRPIVFVGAGAERALVPGLAPSASLGAGLVWRDLRVDLAGQLAPWANASLSNVPGVGADFSLIAVALRACVGHGFSWMAVNGCASVRVARVSGEGTGLTESYRQTADIVSIEPGVLVRVPARTRVALELDVNAVLPITRPDFVIADGDSSPQLFRVSAVGARGVLAASFRF